jgi:lysophospholipase L1-like esterase
MSPYDPEEAPQLDQAMSLITQATNENRQPMVLLWTGSNDLWSLYEWKCTVDSPPSCAEEDLQEFTSNLDTILNRLASTDSKLLIANLDDHSKRPVVADSAYIELRSDITPDELPLLSEQTSHYNTAIRELAKTYEATVVDIFKTTIFQQSETISNYDGDHPNSLGYDQLADIWYQAVLSAFSTVQDPNLVNSNALFDWAEITFPGVFKNPGSKTYRLGDFWVRYYESTNVFLGTTKDDVYVYGDIFGGFMNVGKISNFIVLQ